MITISKEDLSEEEFETIVHSRGFQKMLLYSRLADGIEVLQTHDMLYESMVHTITEEHSAIESVDTTRELLSLLQEEVATYTEPLSTADSETTLLPGDAVASSGVAGTEDESDEPEPETTVRNYLEDRLEEDDEIEVKAHEIASAIGLRSTNVGGILGRWRHADEAPFAISASESTGSGNIWTIKRSAPNE